MKRWQPRLPTRPDFLSRFTVQGHLHLVDSPTRIDPEPLLAEAGFVHRLARALVRRADLASDVAQDVLVAALQQPGPVQQPRAWLAAITRRLAAKAKRAERQRAAREAMAAPPPAGDAERRTAERLQLQQRLCEAVFALPEPYRTTVTLRFFDDLPPRAIARRMSVGSDVVRQRLHRGLTMLRERLDGEFGDRGNWARAFAALGLMPAGSPWLLLTVLAMNKFALAAAATLVAGTFLLWPKDPPPPVETSIVATAPPPARAMAATAPAAAPTEAAVAVERTAAAPTREPACVVVVVDADDAPVAAAFVHGWSEGKEPVVRRTDAEGRCTFGDLDGPGEFLVDAEGRFPHRAHVDRRRGEHRLVLPDGAAIRGVLVVDGGVPAHAWQLALEPIELGPDVPQALAERFLWDRGCSLRVAGDGTFTFTGLPADWTGTLRLPHPLWLLPESGGKAGEPRKVPVQAGAEVRLLTTQLPTLHVHLVWQDDGTPVANASASAFLTFADDPNTPGVGVGGDAEGNVFVGLASIQPSDYLRWCEPANRPAVTRVWLRVDAPGSDGRIERGFSQDELAANHVHTLQLPRSRVTCFVAVDENGAPIEGARVEANDTSEPTDAQGRGTFRGTTKDVRRAGARGYRIAPTTPRAPAAGTAEDPLVFVLMPGNSVRLRFLDAAGRPVEPASVVAHSASPLLTNGTMAASELDRVLGTPLVGGTAHGIRAADGTQTWTDCEAMLEGLRDGEAVIESLVPGQSCTVVVRDPMRTELVRQTFVTPPFGKHETLDLVVPGTPRELRGTILDATGDPIPGARLVLAVRDAERDSTRTTTAPDGTFHFAGIYATGSLRLTASAEGFAAQSHDLPPLADNAPAPVLRLERGNTVTVRVLDDAGQPVDAAPRLAGDGPHEDYDALGPGCRRFRDLPAGSMAFTCEISGTTFELRHDTGQPDAVLRVPVPAKVSLAAANGWPPTGEHSWLEARVQRLDAPAAPLKLSVSDEPEVTLVLPGRYRIELFEGTQSTPPGQPTERAIGLATEVTLVAGEHVRAVIH